jgi:hypothetical protein
VAEFSDVDVAEPNVVLLEEKSGWVIKRRVICENGSHSYIGDVTCGEKKLRLV